MIRIFSARRRGMSRRDSNRDRVDIDRAGRHVVSDFAFITHLQVLMDDAHAHTLSMPTFVATQVRVAMPSMRAPFPLVKMTTGLTTFRKTTA